jgi:serine kinase of HPr protein (carbohydrate metabolism regulator)
MRIIRSVFARECLLNRYIYFHAAAIRYKDKGILLCGSSGKGKTSLLLNYLQTKTGELIANDKVFIGCDNKKGCIVQGWPLL